MNTYNHFDLRNGLSDLENHTLDTKQTFLAVSYPKLDTLTKFRSKPMPKFGQNRSKLGPI